MPDTLPDARSNLRLSSAASLALPWLSMHSPLFNAKPELLLFFSERAMDKIYRLRVFQLPQKRLLRLLLTWSASHLPSDPFHFGFPIPHPSRARPVDAMTLASSPIFKHLRWNEFSQAELAEQPDLPNLDAATLANLAVRRFIPLDLSPHANSVGCSQSP